MKQLYQCFRRENGIYYSLDTLTKKRESLETTETAEARRLLNALNEACQQPAINLQIAQVYLRHSDPDYELLWHLGGSQSDIANLNAENVDWPDGTIAYFRLKTGSRVMFHFGDLVVGILKGLPQAGPLFPNIRKSQEADRATYFKRRCTIRGISGVTLHSYRYAWAQRAKESGYPERFAQEALGHNSIAVHRVYAMKAKVKLPSLEAYERKMVPLAQPAGISANLL